MAVVSLGLLGSGNASTAGTTLAVVNTTGAVIPAGTFVHITGTWDNTATVTAPTITCSTIGGATATANHATPVGSGVTTTAGSGIWHQCFRAVTTSIIAIGATIATLTSDQSAVKRAAHCEGWTGALNTLRGTVTTATSTTGSPTVTTTGTALAVGDLVIGSASFENNAQMVADADTAGGAWPPIVGTFTTGGGAATNVGTATQYKILTATGTQTFNPTGGVADTIACVYSVQPQPDPTVTQAAYRFYADGAEPGTLVDGYDETNAPFGFAPINTIGGDVGQSFVGNGGRLSRARFWMRKNNAPSPTGNITARLYAHTGTYGSTGTGTGAPLATSTSRLRSSLSLTEQWEYFEFDNTFTMAAGTPYVIALTVDDNAGGGTSWGTDNTSPTHAGNASTTTGGVWNAQTFDYSFGVYTDNALAAQDTAYTANLTAGDANLQVRTRLQSTNATTLPATDDWALQWEKNANGTWTGVGVGTSTVSGYDSPNLTDGAATTNRLGAGTGSFVAGKISEDGLVDDLGWTGNNYTELLYSITLKQANLANSDTLRFRVLRNGATTGLTYTQVPTVTITVAAAIPSGTATGTYLWAGAATTGARTPKATGTGAYAWAGTATGKRAPKATGLGAYAWAGTATGKRTPKATTTAAYAWAGSSTGKRTPQAAASGAYLWAGTATGKRTPRATSSGVYAWAGSAAGTAPAVVVNAGTATGTYAWAGAATGAKTPKAAATGAYAYAGTAAGSRPTRGTATGAYAWAKGTTTGYRQPKATTTRSYTWAGTASGAAPGISGHDGFATGSYTWSGSATGQRGTPKATAAGSYAWAGTAAGKRSRTGTATGTYQWAGTAVAHTSHTGQTVGAYLYVGTATGTNALQRDIDPVPRQARFQWAGQAELGDWDARQPRLTWTGHPHTSWAAGQPRLTPTSRARFNKEETSAHIH